MLHFRISWFPALLGLSAATLVAQNVEFDHGTSVVVLRSSKVMFAAVDSKETLSEYRDGELSVAEGLMCKVKRVGPYYSIVSGVTRGTNGFNALQEVAGAYKPGDDLDTLASSLLESVPLTLTPLLKTMHDVDPPMFRKTYTGNAALQLILVGTDQHVPKVVVVEFQAVETSPDTIRLETRTMSCPGTCSTSTVGYFLGAHEAIAETLRREPRILSRPDEHGVEKLIGLEYDSRPDIVGGPISMLKIDRAGSTMLRNGTCALD
jgi:hypothetical protein